MAKQLVKKVRARQPPEVVTEIAGGSTDGIKIPPRTIFNAPDIEGVRANILFYQKCVAEARVGMAGGIHSAPHQFFQSLSDESDEDNIPNNPFVFRPANLPIGDQGTMAKKKKKLTVTTESGKESVVSKSSKKVLHWQPQSDEFVEEDMGKPATTFDRGGMYKLVSTFAALKDEGSDKKGFGKTLRNDIDRFVKGKYEGRWLFGASEYLSARYGVRPFIDMQDAVLLYQNSDDLEGALVMELAEAASKLKVPVSLPATWAAEFDDSSGNISQAERLERVILAAYGISSEDLCSIAADMTQYVVSVEQILGKLRAAKVVYPSSGTIFGENYFFVPESLEYTLKCTNSTLQSDLREKITELANVRGAKAISDGMVRSQAGHITSLESRLWDAYKYANEKDTYEQEKVRKALEDHRATFTSLNRAKNRQLVGFDEPIVREFPIKYQPKGKYGPTVDATQFRVIRSLTPEDRRRLVALKEAAFKYMKVTYKDYVTEDGSGIFRSPMISAFECNSYEHMYRSAGKQPVIWIKDLSPGRTVVSDFIARYGDTVNQFFRRSVKKNLAMVTWQRRVYDAARTIHDLPEGIGEAVDKTVRNVRHTLTYGKQISKVKRLFKRIGKGIDKLVLPTFHIQHDPEVIEIARGSTVVPVELEHAVDTRLQERLPRQIVVPNPVDNASELSKEDRLMVMEYWLDQGEGDSYTVILTSNNNVRQRGHQLPVALERYLAEEGIEDSEKYCSVLRGLLSEIGTRWDAVCLFPYTSLSGTQAANIAYALEELGMDAMVTKRPSKGSTVGEDFIWSSDKVTDSTIPNLAKHIFAEESFYQWAMVHRVVDLQPTTIDELQVVTSLSLIAYVHRSEVPSADEILIRELVQEGQEPIEVTFTPAESEDTEGQEVSVLTQFDDDDLVTFGT